MYKIITLYYKRTGRAVGKSSRMIQIHWMWKFPSLLNSMAKSRYSSIYSENSSLLETRVIKNPEFLFIPSYDITRPILIGF